ncbi:hypothetical protein EZJ43_06295 [Pedobacter changchengzhani]|uniref:Uncharacterized protein n=1 Tax=Pedobacter changchengzhani TaxID=2529274 RepID=A0A4R5MMY1_9SPHI|nr:hypothetical protein [Pedobacter changchengzhani]TDG36886.1 hypothetical protein EZJ43_06295 [Pedobacter changchengzhani]
MTFRYKVLISALGSVILFTILLFFTPVNDRTFINVLSIIGFLLSLLGILIAYFQILSIKTISDETNKKIGQSIELNNKIFTLSDLSRKAAMVDEIMGYLRDNKIDMCILRMKDLKIIINNLRNQEKYHALVSRKQFKGVFDNFNLDLYNFQTAHLGSSINKATVIKHLEDLSTLFLSVEIKLKTHNYDT